MFVYLAALGLSGGIKTLIVVMLGLSYSETCGALVPQAGIEPTSPSIARQILSHWATMEVLLSFILNKLLILE